MQGSGVPTLHTVKTLRTTLQSALRIRGATSADGTNLSAYSTTEKNLSVSGSAKFKYALFKGQVY